jgi:hypothetical protein
MGNCVSAPPEADGRARRVGSWTAPASMGRREHAGPRAHSYSGRKGPSRLSLPQPEQPQPLELAATPPSLDLLSEARRGRAGRARAGAGALGPRARTRRRGLPRGAANPGPGRAPRAHRVPAEHAPPPPAQVHELQQALAEVSSSPMLGLVQQAELLAVDLGVALAA